MLEIKAYCNFPKGNGCNVYGLERYTDGQLTWRYINTAKSPPIGAIEVDGLSARPTVPPDADFGSIIRRQYKGGDI